MVLNSIRSATNQRLGTKSYLKSKSVMPKTIKEVSNPGLFDSTTNLDLVDFNKPEKYLKEIFNFLRDHVIISDSSSTVK